MRRRTFLTAGLVVVATAGCTGDPDVPPPSAPATEESDADARARSEVAQSESLLIELYHDYIAERPELATLLGPFLAHHEAHLARVAPGSATPTASGSAAASPSASEPSEEPLSAATIVAVLADAETAAHRQRVRACDAALGADLARALCVVAASEAQHASVLTALTEKALAEEDAEQSARSAGDEDDQ